MNLLFDYINTLILFFLLFTVSTILYNTLIFREIENYTVLLNILYVTILVIVITISLSNMYVLLDPTIYSTILNSSVMEHIIYRITFLWTTNSNITLLWYSLLLVFISFLIKNSIQYKIISLKKLNPIIYTHIFIIFFIYFIYEQKNYIIQNTFYIYDGFHINPN